MLLVTERNNKNDEKAQMERVVAVSAQKSDFILILNPFKGLIVS